MSIKKPNPYPEWLTTAEVAELLQIPVRTIYAWRAQRQEAPLAIRVGKHLRWQRSALEAWLANRPAR